MISELYGKGKAKKLEIKPQQLPQKLESISEQSREDWPLSVLRALWDFLKIGITRRARSLAHEVAWLSLSGFVLRPGYGAEGDARRIEELWRLSNLGLSHKKEPRAFVQWWILWRRVSGGLNEQQQSELFAEAKKCVENKGSGHVEAYRLLGALERIDVEQKSKFMTHLVKKCLNSPSDELFTSVLGRLGTRVLVYGESHFVIPPEQVEKITAPLFAIDWTAELCSAMRLIARFSKEPEQKVSKEMKERVISKLIQSGYRKDDAPELCSFIPFTAVEEKSLIGDSLPLGLRL